MEQVKCMTFSELKQFVADLARQEGISDETKILLDTGWDSLQEILPDAIKVKSAQKFQVQDELTKEFYNGYTLTEKESKFNAVGGEETVIIIENRY